MAKTSDPRRSRKYQTLRAEFLAAADPVCHWCGREVTDQVSVRHPAKATVDHLLEVDRSSEQQAMDSSLWVVACYGCNSRRGQRYRFNAPTGKPQSRHW